MKILLLGYKGNLGSELFKIINKEHEVTVWESSDLDLENPQLSMEKICHLKPELLINTMAYNAVDDCEDANGYEKAKQLNVVLPKMLADACLKADCILVNYTSDYIFGGYIGDELIKIKNQGGFEEKDTPISNSRYSETKLTGENEIIKLANSGLKYYVIRTSKLFGRKGDSEFAKPSFFDTMLKLSEKNTVLKVVDAEESCFTYTPDLAMATINLVTDKKPWGIYHIVNEGACTWYGGAKALFEIIAKDIVLSPVSPEEFPRPAKRPIYSVLKNTKLKKLRNFQDALREYLTSNN